MADVPLSHNPHGCEQFVQHKFKEDRCASCGCQWHQHLGVIGPGDEKKQRDRVAKSLAEKAIADKKAKDAADRKKREKRDRDHAAQAKDNWFFEGDEGGSPNGAGNDGSDSEDDAFAFYTSDDIKAGKFGDGGQKKPAGERKPMMIKSLIDFDECFEEEQRLQDAPLPVQAAPLPPPPPPPQQQQQVQRPPLAPAQQNGTMVADLERMLSFEQMKSQSLADEKALEKEMHMEEMQGVKSQMQAEIDSLKGELAIVQEECQNLRDQSAAGASTAPPAVDPQIEQHIAILEGENAQLRQAQSQHATFNGEMAAMQQQCNDLIAQNSDLMQQLAEAQAAASSSQAPVDGSGFVTPPQPPAAVEPESAGNASFTSANEANDEVLALRTQVTGLEQTVQALQENCRDLNAKLEESNQRADGAEAFIVELQTTHDDLHEKHVGEIERSTSLASDIEASRNAHKKTATEKQASEKLALETEQRALAAEEAERAAKEQIARLEEQLAGASVQMAKVAEMEQQLTTQQEPTPEMLHALEHLPHVTQQLTAAEQRATDLETMVQESQRLSQQYHADLEAVKQELGAARSQHEQADLAGRQHHADLSAARHELETLKVQHEEQLRKERNSLQQPARDSTADRTQPISPARTTQTYQTDGMSVMSRMPREMPYLVELVLPPGLSWRSVGKPLFNKWTQASGGDSAQVKYVWKVAGKKKVIILACMEDGVSIDDFVEQFEEAADAMGLQAEHFKIDFQQVTNLLPAEFRPAVPAASISHEREPLPPPSNSQLSRGSASELPPPPNFM